jgi:hypothetical protein
MLVQSSVVVALLASVVSAVTNANSNANTTIDPNTVDLTLRSQWCQAEINTCGTLCSGESNSNTCDENTLNYTCTCTSNNSAPGLIYYKETLPTFICEKIFQNCILAGQNDAAAQAVCNRNEKANCGQLSPENFTAAATTSSSASSTTATGTSAAAASGTAASTSSSKAAAATMAVARNCGAGALVAAGAAAFGMML